MSYDTSLISDEAVQVLCDCSDTDNVFLQPDSPSLWFMPTNVIQSQRKHRSPERCDFGPWQNTLIDEGLHGFCLDAMERKSRICCTKSSIKRTRSGSLNNQKSKKSKSKSSTTIKSSTAKKGEKEKTCQTFHHGVSTAEYLVGYRVEKLNQFASSEAQDRRRPITKIVSPLGYLGQGLIRPTIKTKSAGLHQIDTALPKEPPNGITRPTDVTVPWQQIYQAYKPRPTVSQVVPTQPRSILKVAPKSRNEHAQLKYNDLNISTEFLQCLSLTKC